MLALQVVAERLELWIGGEHRREIANLSGKGTREWPLVSNSFSFPRRGCGWMGTRPR